MKTQLVNFFKFSACWLVFILTYTQQNGVYAYGDRTQNGGDPCEKRLRPLQDEIKSWLLRYDEEFLKLPGDLEHGVYRSAMFEALNNTELSCSLDNQKILKSEKTCINTNYEDGTSVLECDIRKVKASSDEELLELMHHEAAGVAGFETNKGKSKSDYFITNQLSGYYEKVTVTKLAIRPVHHKNDVCNIIINPFDWIHGNRSDAYKIAKRVMIEEKEFNLVVNKKLAYLSLGYGTQRGNLLGKVESAGDDRVVQKMESQSVAKARLTSVDGAINEFQESRKSYILFYGYSTETRLEEALNELPSCEEIRMQTQNN